MARLYTMGFEVQSTASDAEQTGVSFQNSPTITTSNVRSGSAALSIGTIGSPNVTFGSLGTLDRAFFFRGYFRLSTGTPGVQTTFMAPWGSGNGFWHAVTWETNGKLRLRDYAAGNAIGTQIGSDSAALSSATYYRIELMWKVNTGGGGSAILLLDGTVVASSNAMNFPNAAFTEIDVGKAGAADTTYSMILDDCALNDDTGSVQNGMPGPGKVVLLKPISDNARIGFTGGAGGTTNLFDAVNNFPPIGSGTPGTNASQIGSANNNATDSYTANLGAFTTALGSGGGGLSTSDTVKLIQFIGRCGNSTTTSRTFGITGVSNPAVSESTAGTGTTTAIAEPTGWTTLKLPVQYNPIITPGTSPTIKVRKGTASINNLMCDMLGAIVEYSPGSLVATGRTQRNMLVRR